MAKLNINNRTIFCRDNLDILEGLNSESVDLMYLDPLSIRIKYLLHLWEVVLKGLDLMTISEKKM